jgi:hypothetical protein
MHRRAIFLPNGVSSGVGGSSTVEGLLVPVVDEPVPENGARCGGPREAVMGRRYVVSASQGVPVLTQRWTAYAKDR